MDKQQLINYLVTNNGKGEKTWLQLAKEFEIREDLDDNKRAKACNDIYRSYLKREFKNLEDFQATAKIKTIRRWQETGTGKWLQSIAYEKPLSKGLDIDKAKRDLVSAIAEYELPKFERVHLDYNQICAVINLYDAHISSLALKSETGEDSDTNDSITKFEKCFDELLTTTEAFNPEIIVFPIGNDFFHENSVANTTKRGTKLDVSGNHFDNFTKGLMLLRRCIDKASQVAKVYIPLVSGNHDEDLSNYLVTALEQIYIGNDNVEIDARRIARKYFRYGCNFLGFTHGDSVKAEQLPLIMAVEQSMNFAETTERIWLTGHVHHQITKEFPGVTVRALRGLAATDKWHNTSGYIGTKKAGNVMLFEFNHGLKSEFSCNIK